MDNQRPQLWVVADSGVPRLRGVRCDGCGTTLFPPQGYGCTVCGTFGERLRACEFPAAGTIVSFAEVHRHHGHPVPFTIADISLDAGPVVRAKLVAGAVPRIGARAEGRVIDGEDGEALEFATIAGLVE